MLISVICRFQDDNTQVIDDQYAGLREAIFAALDLAELHGNDKGDGHGPPRCFDVCVNGASQLSVTVIRGGLVPQAAHPI